MNTVQMWQTTSTNSAATLRLAEEIGSKMRGGEVIELVSDLGGGKTTFVRGLAHGMGSKDVVHSPTFTLNNEYHAKGLTLYHFDFYRLSEPGIMRDELAEVLDDPKAVVAIEWGNIIENVLPKQRLTIHLKSIGENQREIELKYPKHLAHIIDRLS